MSDELVTVYTAMDEADAEVIKVALEAEGIACLIENANQAALAGCIPAYVQVRVEDAERAKSYIAEHESTTDQAEES